MKKFKVITVLAVFFLFFVFTNVCFSQVALLEVNDRGDFRIHENDWRISTTRAEVEALPFADYFWKTIENPGDSVTVFRDEREVGFKFVIKKVWDVNEGRIIYDKDKDLIKYDEFGFQEAKASLVPSFFWISIIFVILSNISFLKMRYKITKNSYVDPDLIMVYTLISLLSLMSFYFYGVFEIELKDFKIVHYVFMFVHFSSAISLALFSNMNVKEERKLYKISSVIYYTLSIVIFILLFNF